MSHMLLIYGRKAYASEIELFRNARVTARRAQSLSVVGRTPAMIFRVRCDGAETFLPDLVEVYRMTATHPDAHVEVIPVHGQSRLSRTHLTH